MIARKWELSFLEPRQTMSAITIDFLSKKMAYRRKRATLKNERLAKALGLKKKTNPPRLIDATAGLGQDSFILACLGFEVTLLERSPKVYALLKKALTSTSKDPALAPIIKRLHLIHADAIQYLAAHKMSYDIIYLDPMFPVRKKSALNKQPMRTLLEIVGDDSDSNQLLQAALACATQRVVVKRPLLAKPLTDLKPSYSLTGTSNRFDIYLIRK
jgi:16S rRNA (guanine1516-N2)-methyltransferase